MQQIQQLLADNPSYKEYLFNCGYLITNDSVHADDQFPFCGQFVEYSYEGFRILVHRKQHIELIEEDNSLFVLIGHAVNPFTGEFSEKSIIQALAANGILGTPASLQYLNELTGNFFIAQIKDGRIRFLTDPAGMLYGCYGIVKGKLYISSYAQLIADIIPLTKSRYIQKLESYRFFRKYGVFFPGDLTQFQELRRILQNHLLCYYDEKIEFKRIYPNKEIQFAYGDEYDRLLHEVTHIIHQTLECYCEKYLNPAISMTGGMDSKTTLACANGLYDNFTFYSYLSMPGDKIDADAAHVIADYIGIPHMVITVPESDDKIENVHIAKAIIEHNYGGYSGNANDVRKRETLRRLCKDNELFGAEVKSWVSEIARANYYKKFGLNKMPKNLSPKHMMSMYKVFLLERTLAHKTTEVFREFINKTCFHEFPKGFDESDMYLWEFRYSAWGGMVITNEHSYSNNILIPYNNRLLLDLMLHAPKEKRITDAFHEDLIMTANKKISETGITITNWNETKKRRFLERAYFLINSHLPF